MKFTRLLALLAFISTPAFAWDITAMNKQIDETNFLVNDNCSATLIDNEKGLLLTANHCISSQFTIVEKQNIDKDGKVTTDKVRVATPGTVSQLYFKNSAEIERKQYVFEIKASDSANDLAVIHVLAKLDNTVAAPLACKNPVRGEHVFAVGNTLGRLYATVSDGIISSVNRNLRMLGFDNDQKLIQATSPVAGGNSGGSLYNDNGSIIGVVDRGYQQVSPIVLAVPLSDVKSFLTSNNITVQCHG